MTFDELRTLVGDGAKEIMEVSKEISDYLEFKTLIDLGLQVHHSELDFDKIMVFSWIKEVLDGRKH